MSKRVYNTLTASGVESVQKRAGDGRGGGGGGRKREFIVYNSGQTIFQLYCTIVQVDNPIFYKPQGND